jgi:hypothetical protein
MFFMGHADVVHVASAMRPVARCPNLETGVLGTQTQNVILQPHDSDFAWRSMTPMGIYYQHQDGHFLDYGMVQLHGEWFRGPLDQGPDAIAWLGAAQTFGRFVAEPAPAMVGKRLGLGTLNLGRGGMGPEYFLRHPELLEEVNRCRVAVIQVMSARASDNSLFRSQGGGSSGIRLDTGARCPDPILIVKDLIAQDKRREAAKISRESQQAYVQSMKRLFDAIKPPKVLFWFSFRSPPPAIKGYRRMIDVFPHLVSRRMVNQIRQSADGYVEVVSRVGIPQVIRDDTGNEITVNRYYPSPEMNQLAADPLTQTLKGILSQ